jgi:Single-strand binding protein family
MTEASVSFAGNLTDNPEVRYTEGGIARAMFRVAVSGRREQEPSFFTVIVWRDQAEHASQSPGRRQGAGLTVSRAGNAPGSGRSRRGALRSPPGSAAPVMAAWVRPGRRGCRG